MFPLPDVQVGELSMQFRWEKTCPFGEFGFRDVGYYYVEDLHSDIKRILGLNKGRGLQIIGIGNLGSSLLGYKDFLRQNYNIVAAFNIDPPKVI